MTLKQIPLDIVKNEIEKIFPAFSLDKWHLSPDGINELAESAEVNLTWRHIKWWDKFEYGDIDVSNEEFFKILFEQIRPTKGELIVVVENHIKDKTAYCMGYHDLHEFVETIYPNIYEMDFFQPSDCIFIFPNDNLITILHHSGYVMQFKNYE